MTELQAEGHAPLAAVAPPGATEPSRPGPGSVSTPETVPGPTGTSRRGRAGERPRRPPRRHRVGTALRLVAFQTTVLAAILGIVVVALAHQFATSYQSIAASTLTGQLASYAAAAHRNVSSAAGLFTFSRRYLQNHSLPSGEQVVVGIPGEGVVGSGGTKTLLSDRTLAALLAGPPPRSHLDVARIGGQDSEVLAAPITVGGRALGTILATTSLASLEKQRARVIELAIGEAGIALVAVTASAYLLLRRLLRTVGRITSTAEEIQEGDLDKRLGDQGTDDEVSHLAGTFDAMLDRLSSVMGSQRRLLSDVSHQLRTPLTVARGHLEVLSRTGWGDSEATADTVGLVLDELGHMSSLVDRLLLLGRAIEPDFLQMEPLDLRAFCADVYEASAVMARRQWSIGAVPDVVLWADSAKLRGALLNVVDNAIKATGPGDAIALSAGVSPDRASVLIAVDDSGPGIPPAQRRAVLERFTRLPGQAAPGSGLGLAIVDAVATAHGGCVEISDSMLGGARVGIRLSSELQWHPGDPTP